MQQFQEHYKSTIDLDMPRKSKSISIVSSILSNRYSAQKKKMIIEPVRKQQNQTTDSHKQQEFLDVVETKKNEDVLRDFTDQSLTNNTRVGGLVQDLNHFAGSKTPDLKSNAVLNKMIKKKKFMPVLVSSRGKAPSATVLSKTQNNSPMRTPKNTSPLRTPVTMMKAAHIDQLPDSQEKMLLPNGETCNIVQQQQLVQTNDVDDQQAFLNLKSVLQNKKLLSQEKQKTSLTKEHSISSLDKVLIKYQSNALLIKRPQTIINNQPQQQTTQKKISVSPAQIIRRSVLVSISPSRRFNYIKRRPLTPSATISNYQLNSCKKENYLTTQNAQTKQTNNFMHRHSLANSATTPNFLPNNGDLDSILTSQKSSSPNTKIKPIKNNYIRSKPQPSLYQKLSSPDNSVKPTGSYNYQTIKSTKQPLKQSVLNQSSCKNRGKGVLYKSPHSSRNYQQTKRHFTPVKKNNITPSSKQTQTITQHEYNTVQKLQQQPIITTTTTKAPQQNIEELQTVNQSRNFVQHGSSFQSIERIVPDYTQVKLEIEQVDYNSNNHNTPKHHQHENEIIIKNAQQEEVAGASTLLSYCMDQDAAEPSESKASPEDSQLNHQLCYDDNAIGEDEKVQLAREYSVIALNNELMRQAEEKLKLIENQVVAIPQQDEIQVVRPEEVPRSLLPAAESMPSLPIHCSPKRSAMKNVTPKRAGPNNQAAYLKPTISSQIKKDISMENLTKRDRAFLFGTDNSAGADAIKSARVSPVAAAFTERFNYNHDKQQIDFIQPQTASPTKQYRYESPSLYNSNNQQQSREKIQFSKQLNTARSYETTPLNNKGLVQSKSQQLLRSRIQLLRQTKNCNNIKTQNYKVQQNSYFLQQESQEVQEEEEERELEESFSSMRHQHHQTQVSQQNQARNQQHSQNSLNHHRAVLHNLIMSKQQTTTANGQNQQTLVKPSVGQPYVDKQSQYHQAAQEQLQSSNNYVSGISQNNERAVLNSAGTVALAKSNKYHNSSNQRTKKHSIDSQGSISKNGEMILNEYNNNNSKVVVVKMQNKVISNNTTGKASPERMQPGFVPTVTKANAGRLLASYGGAIAESNGIIDRHLYADHHSSKAGDTMIGQDQLQEILTEVASIEQKYSKNNPATATFSRQIINMKSGIQQQDGGCLEDVVPTTDAPHVWPNIPIETDQDNKSSSQLGSGRQHQKGQQVVGSADPYALRKQHQKNAVQAMFGTSGKVFQDSNNNQAQTYNQQQQQQKMKNSTGGNTGQTWHKHQQSMKLTSVMSNVTSPRKQSHQNNTSSKGRKAAMNQLNHQNNQVMMQNTYITYNRQANNNDYARGNAGRKSLNLPVRNSSHRSQKYNQSNLRENQHLVQSIAGSNEQIHQINSQQQVTSANSIVDGSKRDTAVVVSNNLKVMSNEANHLIKTDQEHFGSFMISTNQQPQAANKSSLAVVDSLIPTLPHQKQQVSGRNSRTSNSHQRNNSSNATTSPIGRGSNSVIALISGSGQILSGTTPGLPLSTVISGNNQRITYNQTMTTKEDEGKAAAMDVFLHTTEEVMDKSQKLEGTKNDHRQQLTLQNSHDYGYGDCSDDAPPQLINSVSPDHATSGQRSRKAAAQTFSSSGQQHQQDQAATSTFLLRDIQRGEQKLGRALNKDSALAGSITGGKSSAKPLQNTASTNHPKKSQLQSQSTSSNYNHNVHQDNFSNNNMRSSTMSNNKGGGQQNYKFNQSTNPQYINNNMLSSNSHRPSKSPLPSKKNQNQHHQQKSQKQSLKQLGISYGILAKQDTENKLIARKKRGGRSKDHQIHLSPKKLKDGKKCYQQVENMYNISAPHVDQDIVLEGTQLVSYDEQTSLSPVQSQQALIIKSTAQSQVRLTQQYFGSSANGAAATVLMNNSLKASAMIKNSQEPGKTTALQQFGIGAHMQANSPQRFGNNNQARGSKPSTVLGGAAQQQITAQQNQLIMKRMPEPQIASSLFSGPPAYPGNPTQASGLATSNHYLPQTQRGRMFKYQVISGNNAALVKRVMHETRSYLWAEMLNNQQSHFHFRWSPGSRQVNFDRLSHNFGQMVNHFEHHHEITTKNELFKNLKGYNDELKQNAFYTIPLTFCLKISADRQAQSIKQQLKPFKEVFNLLEEFKDHCNPDLPGQQPSSAQLNTSNVEVTPDTSMELLDRIKPFDKVVGSPMTVLVTKKGQNSGYRDIVSNSHGDGGTRIKKFTSRSSGLVMPMCHFTGQNVWILKPTGFNRGKGIHVVNSIKKLKRLIKEYSRGKDTGPTVASIYSGSNLLSNTSTLYPTSKFMEPQALNTQQMMIATMQAALQKGQPIPQMPLGTLSAQKQSRQSLGLNSTGNSTSTQPPKFINAIKNDNKNKQDNVVTTPIKDATGLLGNKELPMTITSFKNKQRPSTREILDGQEPNNPSPSTVNDLNNDTNAPDIQVTSQQSELKQKTIAVQHPKTAQAPSNFIINEKAEVRGQQATTYHKPSIRSQTFIIQKYIEKPLLVNQRKFDIRVWVTLTQDMDVYFFREGYLRTSSQPYSMNAQNLDDDFVHLTNNAIQKNSPEYGNHEDGNMLSFNDFKKMIRQSNASVDFETDILAKMKYLCALTLQTIKKKINPSRRKHCFELFGFDYFIDADYNVFLIEVNTNPCLEESSRLLQRLLPRMLDDLFKLTIDQIYLPTKDLVQAMQPTVNQINHQKNEKSGQNYRLQTGKSLYPVDGYKDNYNMWEKISTLKQSASVPISITNPYQKQLSRSTRLIHLVNQYEMRVAQPDLTEKGIKRDMQLTGSSQLSGFVDY